MAENNRENIILLADSETDVKLSVKEQANGKLSMFGLVSIVFFMVCGGSYGTEDLGGSIPPLFALAGILLIPWLWSFPIAMITAELATAMPSNEGCLGWIKQGQFRSFHDRNELSQHCSTYFDSF
jgi:hypothetical protein